MYVFSGWQLAQASSQRPGVVRWSELYLYRTMGGEYYLQKIGRSTVAHRETCRYVNHRMPSWLDAGEEGRVHRTACIECQPEVGDRMDPHTRLEPQRYSMRRSRELEGIFEMLAEGRDRDTLPPIVARLMRQAVAWEHA